MSIIDDSPELGWDGLALSEPVVTNMALSTLLLRDIQHQHRRNQQLLKNTTPGGPMPEIQESPDEENPANPVEIAAAALSVAVKNISSSSRKTNL